MKVFKKAKMIIFVSRLNFKKMVTYKVANISGFIVNIFWLIVQANVLAAFIDNGISNYTPEQGIGYMIVTEALLMITGLSGGLGGIDIDGLLKSGDIINYWIKPLGFVAHITGMELGRVTYYLIWRCIPVFITGCLLLQWFPRVSFSEFILFCLSVIIAIILANLVEFVIAMLAIRNKTTNGIMDLFMAIALFFSGGLLPLNLFPEWLYKISLCLPFSAQIYLPTSILLGTEENSAQLLILEMLWSIVLMIISYILYVKERRNLLVQGG